MNGQPFHDTKSTLCSIHGRTGSKKLGERKEDLPDFFGLCPSCQKNFPEKLSKIVVGGGGGGGKESLRKIPIR
jgi:hypothetical protein